MINKRGNVSQKVGLILGPGAICGAYGAGVASVLGRNIYFHRVHGCSVGVFAATFLVTEQFDIMLDVWRNYVHGKLLINLTNPLRSRNILDLEYLTGLFRKNSHVLSLDKVALNKGRLVHVLTDCLSGKPEYFCPTGENVFDSMTASSAVPYLHPKIKINGRYFYDGGFSEPYPLSKALEDGNEKVIIVSNYTKIEVDIGMNSNVVWIRPLKQILHSKIDTDKIRINQTIDMGIRDAEDFLRANGSF